MPDDASIAFGPDAAEYLVKGTRRRAGTKALQAALASVYDTPERPRCMCVPAGVEMYVAKYDAFVVKRLPDTGASHSVGCAHFEPPAGESGLGNLLGAGIVARGAGYAVKLAVALRQVPRRGAEPAAASTTVRAPRAAAGKIGLRALTHLLWYQAGINRWVPAMAGKRTWGALRHYLLQAARVTDIDGQPLAELLLLAAPFHRAEAAKQAQDRATFLASRTRPNSDGVASKLVVLGELKAVALADSGELRVHIKHMPERPFLLEAKVWKRAQSDYRWMFDAKAVDEKLRLMLTALLSAKSENVYCIESPCLVLATEDWIPVESMGEVELIRALIAQGRAFYKPLPYASPAALYPTAVLTDVGAKPFMLDLVSAFADEKMRQMRLKAIHERGATWRWTAGEPMPPLPARVGQASRAPGAEQPTAAARR